MKIDSLNNSSIDVVKNEFNLTEKALLVSIIVLIIIESVLLTLLLTGVGSALPLSISLCVFLVILVVLAIALLVSYYAKEKFFKIEKPKEPPKEPPKVEKPKESPKEPPKVEKPKESPKEPPKVEKPKESPKEPPKVEKPKEPPKEPPKVEKPKESPKEPPKVEKPKEPPKEPPTSPPPPVCTFPEILISSEEEEELLKDLSSKNKEKLLLFNCLQKLSYEEALNMHMEVFLNPSEMIRANALKFELEQWVKKKILSLAYLNSYSPYGDGNCLLNAITYAMRKTGLEIPNLSVLRIIIVEFLKENLLKDNISLEYVLNEVIECMLDLEETSIFASLDEKKATICQKCSLFSSNISKNIVSLDILPGNNITSYLTTYNNKEIKNTLFLLEFLEIYTTPGIFLGPSAVYALAHQLGVTIFLYISPPLTKSTLMCMGEMQKDLSFCITADNCLAVGGPDWEKNIMVFNAEAQSEMPICLGLLVNHFVVLNMGEKTSNP